MKKFKITFIFLITLLFTSCNQNIPVINHTRKPFVVTKIEKHSDDFSVYHSKFASNNVNALNGKTKIILPTGMFNIGDTIVLVKPEPDRTIK